MNVRHAILTLACFSLLSSGALGMPPETPTDPMTQTSPGMSSDSGMSADTERQMISGEILRVQDELYVVKESSGKEVSLHVDDSTQKSEELKEGDRIEAEIAQDGHAFTLRKAQDMN